MPPQPGGREGTGRGSPPRRGIDGGRVLGALGDADCRAILGAVEDEAMVATEFAVACDLPLSTTYRKLNQLAAVGLVDVRTRFDPDRSHRNEYRVAAEGISVTLDGDGQMQVIVAFGDDREPLVCPVPD